MAQAVLVKENNGHYQIVGDVEDWDVVQQHVDHVQVIEPLLGWTPYTHAYELRADDNTWTYFVAVEAEA